MKLLFLTQVLDADDAVLGFVPRWIEAFAKRCERVRVIALEVGNTRGLPGNVDVRELGRGGNLGRYLRNRKFLREALLTDRFDAVLAHMVPRYSVLAARTARKAGARQFLWYTHGTADERLRRAVELVDKVFTASEESLRVQTPKKIVTGHGIDLEHFAERGAQPRMPPRILSVGRLTPSKDPLTVLAAVAILVSRGFDLQLDLVGDVLAPGDAAYRRRVEDQIEVGGLQQRVTMHGSVAYRDVPAIYRAASVVVNASTTGSIDKVVLEAMACMRPVVTCNDSFQRLFRELGPSAERLMFAPGSADQLADRIEALLRMRAAERRALTERLHTLVARDHEVEKLIERLCREMESGA